MKARRFFAFVAAIATLFAVGCTPDNNGGDANGEKAVISVTPTSFAVDSEGGEQTITVTSNAAWTVSSTASDVTFEPAAGSGDGSVVVTVPASASDREFTITFSAEKQQIVEGMVFPSNAKAVVAVSQNAGGQNMTEFLYYEKVGEGNVDKIDGEWPYIDQWTGWLPEGPAAANVTYSGKKASVRASGGNYQPTADAVGLTGQPYVFLNKLPVEAYFVIENLAVTGGANYTFKFNVSCQTGFSGTPTFAVVDNSLVHLELGYDGKEWDAVDCEFVENGGNGWYAATAQFKVAADATTLYARLTYEAPASNGGGRFDDFKLVEGGNGDELAPEAPVVSETTIADIKAAGNYTVKNAWVVATYDRGCLLTDASGAFILAFEPTVKPAVGAKLNIEGAVSAYGGLLQFGEGSVIATTGETVTVTYPTPEKLDGAKVDALIGAITIKYVEYEGTLSSGSFHNVTIAGTSNQGSIQYPDEALKATLTALNGKTVKVTGYTIGVAQNKYLQTMATSVVEGTATEPEQPEQPENPTVKTLPYEESFNTSKGDFTINDVALGGLNGSVWGHKTYNSAGYMNASAFVNNIRYATESWLVSPEISLAGATAPELTFEHTHKFAGTPSEELTLWVKESGATDWAQVVIPTYGTNADWVWVTATVDLSAYAGKTIQFAYKYTSTTSTAATWEIRNVNVAEKGATTEPEQPETPDTPDTPVTPVDGLVIAASDIATVVQEGTYKLTDGTEQKVDTESTWFNLTANGLSLTGCRVLINNNKDPYKGHAQFQGDGSNVAKQGFLGNTLTYNDKAIKKIVVEAISSYATPSFNVYYGTEKLPNTTAIATTADNCVKGASAGMDGSYEAFAFTCTFDIPAGNKFFAVRNDSAGATYIKNITIVFEE